MYVGLVWITYFKKFLLIIFSIDVKWILYELIGEQIFEHVVSTLTCGCFGAQNIKFILHRLWNIYVTKW